MTLLTDAELADIQRRDCETGRTRPWTEDAHDRRSLLGHIKAFNAARMEFVKGAASQLLTDEQLAEVESYCAPGGLWTSLQVMRVIATYKGHIAALTSQLTESRNLESPSFVIGYQTTLTLSRESAVPGAVCLWASRNGMRQPIAHISAGGIRRVPGVSECFAIDRDNSDCCVRDVAATLRHAELRQEIQFYKGILERLLRYASGDPDGEIDFDSIEETLTSYMQGLEGNADAISSQLTDRNQAAHEALEKLGAANRERDSLQTQLTAATAELAEAKTKLAESERDCEQMACYEQERHELAAALGDLAERAERARKILTSREGGKPTNWAMLDTTEARKLLGDSPTTPAPSASEGEGTDEPIIISEPGAAIEVKMVRMPDHLKRAIADGLKRGPEAATSPPDPEFKCPKCGCSELDSTGDRETEIKEPIVCGRSRCRWSGTWAEVAAIASKPN